MVQIERGGRMSKYTEALSSVYFTLHNRVKPKALGHCEDKNLELLEELVERATPKKPKSEKEIFCLCPICKEFVGDEFDKNNYCPVCGQAIDWSE